jgi:hypothetical protein
MPGMLLLEVTIDIRYEYSPFSEHTLTALAREMANYLNEIFASRLIKPLGITALIIVLVKLLFFVNALTQLILHLG